MYKHGLYRDGDEEFLVIELDLDSLGRDEDFTAIEVDFDSWEETKGS